MATDIFYSIDELKEVASGKAIVATMGFFDGVHKGHRHLVAELISLAKERQARSLIITLAQHPREVLSPTPPSVPYLLSTYTGRIRELSHLGADYLLVLPFDHADAKVSAEEFVAPLMEAGVIEFLLGYDNRFGYRTEGETLSSFDARLRAVGLVVNRVMPFQEEHEVVSSSRIRQALAKGDMRTVEELLGRPYSIEGVVASGRQIGRTIGYPTANVVAEDQFVIAPMEGIYVSEAVVDGVVYPSMSYYGTSPTISSDEPPQWRLETFILDFDADLYGREMEVRFRDFIREDISFPSLEALQAQLKRDEETTRSYFNQRKEQTA